MAFQSKIAGSQIDGDRDYQEDAFLITHLSDAQSEETNVLVIVADGMGGHAAGNVASNMAVQAFNKTVASNYPTNDISGVLNNSILNANKAIAETIEETPALEGMGCTMVGAVIQGNKLWWVSVGDSHLYLVRDKELIKLNEDHSYGGFLDRMEAQNTPIEHEEGLSRNMLMSALTGKDIAEIDCRESPFKLQHHDKIILCSDGADTLTHGKIIQYSDWSESAKECSEALLSAVEEAAMPRQDNTTVVSILITDSSMTDAESVVEKSTSGTLPIPDSPLLDEEEDEEGSVPITQKEAFKAKKKATEPPLEKDTEEDTGKGKKKVFFGIAAVLFIGVVVAMFGDKMISLVSTVSEVDTASAPQRKDAVVDAKPPPATREIAKKPAQIGDKKPTPPPPKPAVAKTPPPQPKTKEAVASATPPVKEVATPPVKEVVTPPVKKEFQDSLKGGGKGPMMVVIPSGTFDMGSPGTSRFADERPQRKVKVASFAVSKYEVTFAEYDRFAKVAGKKPPKDSGVNRKTHPVVYVSWDDAYNYSRWLSTQTGKKYRLLSESEWEYMAGGGVKSTFWWGFSAEADKAHCFDCDTGLNSNHPTKIGRFDENIFGVYDVAGNAAEWVQDCWHKNYKTAPNTSEVWEGGDCANRVVRGGSYITPIQSIRHTKRDRLKSGNAYEHVGIRLARSLN